MPALTRVSRASSGSSRSSASGCSLEIISTRAPPLRISGSSGACSMPSTVQSTTKPAEESAATTEREWPITSVAPVERTGTAAFWGGVGITRW